MRITRPYGKTSTDGTSRKLILSDKSTHEITDFAAEHPALLVAQWISVLDKIATKPSGDKKATPEQRAFRDRLGQALWAELEPLLPEPEPEQELGSVPESGPEQEQEQESKPRCLRKLWDSKVHPYPKQTEKAKKGGGARKGGKANRGGGKQQEQAQPKLEGRWYGVFCGKTPPDKIDAEAAKAVARKVRAHLHDNQMPIHPSAREKQSGLIASRARSIEGNVLKLRDPEAPKRRAPEAPMSEQTGEADTQTLAAYKKDGIDPVQAIHAKVEEKKNCTAKGAHHISARILREHYGRLFGENCTMQSARDKSPDLFAMHQHVKATYRQLLKRSRKRGDGLLRILPQNIESLWALSSNVAGNQFRNDDIRLGKVIHYHLLNAEGAVAGNSENRKMYRNIWQARIGEIEASPFWHSEGQTTIKRTEAFIRVFRLAIASMARNLREMSQLESTDQDILIKDAREAVLENFSNAAFENRIKVLFGTELAGNLLLKDAAANKAFFEYLLKHVSELRNSIFHFKNLPDLRTQMRGLETASSELDSAASSLRGNFARIWKTHQADRRERLMKTLEGLNIADYIEKDDIEKIIRQLTTGERGVLPLPRFNRLIKTAKNLDLTLLAGEINRHNLEKHQALRCQYGVMKLLYEIPFRAWLDNLGKDKLNGFISDSIAATTTRAKKMNTRRGDEDVIITSKAEKIIAKHEFDNLAKFLHFLTGETATEMRVQKGYESDPEAARKQADFIEKLKCDVLARAFRDWLASVGLENLAKIDKDAPPSGDDIDVENIAKKIWDSVPITKNPGWLHGFYILLYLMPVSSASEILHQLHKWQSATHKQHAAASKQHAIEDNKEELSDDEVMAGHLIEAFGLYLDMHDAVHTGGGASLADDERIINLFESQDDFGRVFPEAADPSQPEGNHLPIRGLREMIRFGGLKTLGGIFANRKISHGEVEEWLEKKETISKAQTEREQLHEKLCRQKRPNKAKQEAYENSITTYIERTEEIAAYRHLAGQVTLTNHVRLHQMLVEVLARLADFTGLWERDLYFITLAKIYRANKTPEEIFTEDTLSEGDLKSGGMTFLAKGQIVNALRKVRNKDEQDVLSPGMLPNGQGTVKRGGDIIGLRNNFAHFNMLREGDVNLTDEINKARRLMCYDRKLKNAVSKSIAERLHRHGLRICWQTTAGHDLSDATIESRTIRHLNGKGGKEELQGDAFTAMVANLFGGSVKVPHKHNTQGGREHDRHESQKGGQQSKGHKSGKRGGHHGHRRK